MPETYEHLEQRCNRYGCKIEKLESAINFALDECRQTQVVCGRGWWDLVINRLEQALKGK